MSQVWGADRRVPSPPQGERDRVRGLNNKAHCAFSCIPAKPRPKPAHIMTNVTIDRYKHRPAMFLAAALFMLMILHTGTASAEHEADHRYIVEGYVLDARENPRADLTVAVTADEGLLGETVTDRRGFYRVRLHLHNTDLGKQLTVKAGDREARIEVAFDPGDAETDRVHDLNFVGADVTEVDLGTRGFPTWAYVVIGILVVLLVARTIAQALKKRRKLQVKQEQKQGKKKHKKGKKGKKGKRRGRSRGKTR